MELTEGEIKEDIQGFKDKILEAEQRLIGLPDTVFSYSVRKRVDTQRRELKSDIKHYEKLVEIAREALP